MIFSNSKNSFSKILNVVVGVLDGLVLIPFVIFFLFVQNLHGLFGSQLGVHDVPENHHIEANKRAFDGPGEQVVHRVGDPLVVESVNVVSAFFQPNSN